MLPITFDLAKYPTVDTIRLLASLLERMTIANDLLNKSQQPSAQRRGSLQQAPPLAPPPPPAYTRFHARLVPSIDIYSYLTRILKYCPCANECFLSLLVYFDRMSKNSLALTGKPFTIDSFNIHRLIIAGVMVASKFFSDVFYTNTRYAKVGGLPVSELNSLELEFLKLNSFNLTVSISELQKYGDQLLKVGYMTQEMRKPPLFRHSRSSSVDQVDRMCDLTQRLSIDEHYQPQQQQQQQQQQQTKYYYNQKKHNNQAVRKMTSTNSLKENGRYTTYEQPRHSRSSVNLNQGFWKPSSPLQQQGEESTSRRLSLTSIHAAPFIPSSELQQQVQAQQQQQHQQQQHQQQQHHHQQQIQQGVYYYPPVGIPTPPPSASPIHHHQSYSAMYL